MALLILALLQRIFLMSSLMLLLVWLIFFMVLIKLLPILGTISGKTVKLDRKSGSAGMPRPISYAVFCLKKKRECETRRLDLGLSLPSAVIRQSTLDVSVRLSAGEL